MPEEWLHPPVLLGVPPLGPETPAPPHQSRASCLAAIGLVVAIVGVLGALAIYALSTCGCAARSSEAKNTIGAISRCAIAKYNANPDSGEVRALAIHELCSTTTAVPTFVPRGTKYLPKEADWGQDWHCLRFQITDPFRYQYRYIAAGPFRAPERGGPNPGNAGFEASAEGDLNGDGVTSLFTVQGIVDAKGPRLDKQLFISKELE